LAARVLTGLGVPDAERLASSAVALIFGLQLRSLATGLPAEELVDALMLLARGAQHS
jgi:TetR/AcrR family transcriptional regulator, regulator of biofilm formation and stress response